MNRLRTTAGALLAFLILLGGLLLAWLAIKTIAIRVMPSNAAVLSTLAPGSSMTTFDRAMMEFEMRGGRVDPALSAAVRDAARHAPLSAVPYLLAGVQDLVAHRDRRALAAFEAGRRLDPRDRWLNILLLDRYLRLQRYDQAVEEFGVLSRLVGPANQPIATMLAQMAVDPATRNPVRQTLARDPNLEIAVLGALATSGAPPGLVMSMASPRAMAFAARPDGWGVALVDRLVAQRYFEQARRIWQRIFHVPTAMAASPIYDAELRGIPGGPPFGWTLMSGEIGGVDIRNRQLEIDYYGRDSGTLASQLLLLAPGRYQFSFQLSGSADQGATAMHWSVTCDDPPDSSPRSLVDLPIPTPRSGKRRLNFMFDVPAGCPAQWLRLNGVAGEFPTPVAASIDGLSLQRLGAGS